MAVDYNQIASGMRYIAKRYRFWQALHEKNTTYTDSGNPDINTTKALMQNANNSFNDDEFERAFNQIAQSNLNGELSTIEGFKGTVAAESDSFLTTVAIDALEMGDGSAGATDVISFLAEEMTNDSENIVENSVGVTAPSADSANVGNGSLYASVLRAGWGDADTVDNETIVACDITAEVTSANVGPDTDDGDATITLSMRDEFGNLIDSGDITVLTDSENQQTGTADGSTIVSDGSFEGDLASGSGGWEYSGNFSLTSSAGDPFKGDVAGLFASTANTSILQDWGIDGNNVIEAGQMIFGSFRHKNKTASGTAGTVTMYINGPDITKTTIATASPTSTTYAEAHGFARVPKTTGTTYGLYLSATGNDQPILIDCVRATTPTTIGGVLWAATRGATDFVVGDRFTAGSTTNDEAGKLQTLMRDVYNMQLPSTTSGSETIDESDV